MQARTLWIQSLDAKGAPPNVVSAGRPHELDRRLVLRGVGGGLLVGSAPTVVFAPGIAVAQTSFDRSRLAMLLFRDFAWRLRRLGVPLRFLLVVLNEQERALRMRDWFIESRLIYNGVQRDEGKYLTSNDVIQPRTRTGLEFTDGPIPRSQDPVVLDVSSGQDKLTVPFAPLA